MCICWLIVEVIKVLMIRYGTVVIVGTNIVEITVNRLQQRVSKYSRNT